VLEATRSRGRDGNEFKPATLGRLPPCSWEAL
jgi:hypothetical protein